MTGPAHPRHRLDELIHAPVRLSLVSMLSRVDSADFRSVRDALQVSDSVLSKQVAVLEAAGYLAVRKERLGRRPQTWLALTGEGRAALTGHLAALAEITSGTPAAAAGRP